MLGAVTLPRFGDFDSMLARRIVRVLVSPNQTHYFLDQGTPRGLTVDAAALFEAELNRKHRTGSRPFRVILIPVQQDELLASLLAGRGDIVASGLTITPERKARADFSNPTFRNVSEIVVTGPASPHAGYPGRSRRPGSLRPTVLLVLWELAAPECGVPEARARARPPARGAGSAGERGPARDVERRPGVAGGDRRLPGHFLGPGAPRHPAPAGPRHQHRRGDRLDVPEGQSTTQAGNQRLPGPVPRGIGHPEHAAPSLPQEHTVRPERHERRPSWRSSTASWPCSGSTASSTTWTSCS